MYNELTNKANIPDKLVRPWVAFDNFYRRHSRLNIATSTFDAWAATRDHDRIIWRGALEWLVKKCEGEDPNWNIHQNHAHDYIKEELETDRQMNRTTAQPRPGSGVDDFDRNLASHLL